MEIVIKLGEEQYNIIYETMTSVREEIRKNGYAKKDTVPLGWQAIVDGIQLPKNHGRLVDENPVIAQLVYREHLLADNVKCGQVTEIFNNAVVIEADKG